MWLFWVVVEDVVVVVIGISSVVVAVSSVIVGQMIPSLHERTSGMAILWLATRPYSGNGAEGNSRKQVMCPSCGDRIVRTNDWLFDNNIIASNGTRRLITRRSRGNRRK